jgi:hypothetical protein
MKLLLSSCLISSSYTPSAANLWRVETIEVEDNGEWSCVAINPNAMECNYSASLFIIISHDLIITEWARITVN